MTTIRHSISSIIRHMHKIHIDDKIKALIGTNKNKDHDEKKRDITRDITRDDKKIKEEDLNDIHILTVHSSDKKDIDVSKKEKTIESISFSGGGYNCTYHMGIIKYIFENSIMFKNTKYLGASGGAGICAIILCFESDPERFNILEQMINVVIEMKNMDLDISDQVKHYTDELIKHITVERFDKYIKDKDRCYISVTCINNMWIKNEIKSSFNSYTEFIDTIKASACIPILLDNQIRKIGNDKYIDGGLSNNIPVLNNNTIKISCLDFPLQKYLHSPDVYPKSVYKIKHCFTPPDKTYIMNMYTLGYEDIMVYFKDKKTKFDTISDNNRFKSIELDILEYDDISYDDQGI